MAKTEHNELKAGIFTLIALGFWQLVGPKLEEKYLEVQA